MSQEETESTEDAGVKGCSIELFCDHCGHYPIEPVHGHFVCPACHIPTKCCEGVPLGD